MTKLLSTTTSSTANLDLYVYECQRLNTAADAGICAALKFHCEIMVVDKPIQAIDMLPLNVVLERCPHLKELHLPRSRLSRAGVILLVDCLSLLPNLVLLNLEGCRIGSPAIFPLLDYLSDPKCPLVSVNFRRCSLGHSVKDRILCTRIVSIDITSPLIAIMVQQFLNNLDVSSNQLGESIVTAIQECDTAITVDCESNLYVHEVINSITHGIGFIVAIMCSWILIKKALLSPNWRPLLGTAPYTFALCLTYLSSTLYHSLFKLRAAKSLFKYLDHGSVFTLIAGTYTPFLVISLEMRPEIAQPMLLAIWLLACFGLYFSTFMRTHKHFTVISTTLYLTMGWMCVVAAIPVIQSKLIPEPALFLLLQGGVAYTIGVLFLIQGHGRPAMHIIWHLWVLVGSALHYMAILFYVVDSTSPSS